MSKETERERCFADIGTYKCSALKKKDCVGCAFYKPRSEFQKEAVKYNKISFIDLMGWR